MVQYSLEPDIEAALILILYNTRKIIRGYTAYDTILIFQPLKIF